MDKEQERQQQLQLSLQDRLQKVSPELFAEFLSKKGVNSEYCPVCGSNDIGTPQVDVMTVGPDGASRRTYIDYVKLIAGGTPHSLAHYQYRLICNTCGYTAHFAVYPVLKWVEDKDE
ncbi:MULTISPECIES: hypothetical protein [Klebsiella]|uniref:hypothetical protein n=1 Tax=Klebsiella TaxID=570 RepID=UPI000462A669|nr:MULTISPECIES: hypothetical protein [Klebsiella]MBZ7133444.1 hypothetical protein [Klebsiella michiganensis]MDM4408627.1 hypothetical protein [Klebsiella oxytoca]HBV6758986.1 hypothetical protein [Klebsiella oxytoca]HBV8803756.1 hypothetical protein [Klebsiella oxytoca]HEC2112018.1 hypothetical protein [Klebsiella oxytoca]